MRKTSGKPKLRGPLYNTFPELFKAFKVTKNKERQFLSETQETRGQDSQMQHVILDETQEQKH